MASACNPLATSDVCAQIQRFVVVRERWTCIQKDPITRGIRVDRDRITGIVDCGEYVVDTEYRGEHEEEPVLCKEASRTDPVGSGHIHEIRVASSREHVPSSESKRDVGRVGYVRVYTTILEEPVGIEHVRLAILLGIVQHSPEIAV